MQIFADLHIHSRFSRATSKDITIQQLEKWAKIKGIDLLGTGDFTHPLWLKELKENLTEDGSGFLKTKTGFTFVLQTEISLIYSQANKGRRIHLVVLAPSFSIVDQINDWLSKKGRLDYDGRPIFNISCPEFVEKLKAISKDIEIIPAHAWTPWFGVFGSKTGFDSLEECFRDQTKHISAIETGLSSD
ncbi:MAG TPA: DNA helicase UvrD, partial [Candidatus Woesearchaeota archaeon]|nr:DNA helicase UvrD [Candidatus Woesearchaeota archaeon]